jgi:hypothetical protein
MEWMLQVLDEVDDVIGALRFCCAGVAAEIVGRRPAAAQPPPRPAPNFP